MKGSPDRSILIIKVAIHYIGNISARNTLRAEMLLSVWPYVACCAQHATWFLGLERVSIEELHVTSRASYITVYVAINIDAWVRDKQQPDGHERRRKECGVTRSRGSYL